MGAESCWDWESSRGNPSKQSESTASLRQARRGDWLGLDGYQFYGLPLLHPPAAHHLSLLALMQHLLHDDPIIQARLGTE